MASLSYDDTQPVPRRTAPTRSTRRLTTQFAPERRRIGPWVIVIALWIAAAARPIDPTHSVQLDSTATQLLGR
jgi:hypothetical protein